MFENIAGIDFGAKLSGKTSIAFIANHELQIVSCAAKMDADNFILTFINQSSVKTIFLDAPLSLPIAYKTPITNPDFFYRECDKATNAMSPLFLGGLTARAMALKHQLDQHNIRVFETYPTALCKQMNIERDKSVDGVKQMFRQIKTFVKDININIEPNNIHELDAILALFSGIRYIKNEHLTIGNLKEGLIII
jgi:predicted nuclease with RNAse H fold